MFHFQALSPLAKSWLRPCQQCPFVQVGIEATDACFSGHALEKVKHKLNNVFHAHVHACSRSYTDEE